VLTWMSEKEGMRMDTYTSSHGSEAIFFWITHLAPAAVQRYSRHLASLMSPHLRPSTPATDAQYYS
jgi:hypothetical protein